MIETTNRPKPSFFKDALWQIIPVMIGVFLGLWANNLNEDRKRNNLQVQILQKVKQDVQANRNQLANVLDYHQMLGDTSNTLLQNADLKTLKKSVLDLGRDSRYDFWRGTRTGPLRDAGYQTAVVTGILADLEIDLVTLLSEINQEQQSYQLITNNYLQSFINQRMDALLINRLVMISSFSLDITIMENNLIVLYDKALEKLP